jgi:hypothetical protein
LPLQSAKIAAQLPITFNKNENGRLFFIFNAQYEMSLPGTARKKKKKKKGKKRKKRERTFTHGRLISLQAGEAFRCTTTATKVQFPKPKAKPLPEDKSSRVTRDSTRFPPFRPFRCFLSTYAMFR